MYIQNFANIEVTIHTPTNHTPTKKWTALHQTPTLFDCKNKKHLGAKYAWLTCLNLY